MDTENLSKTGHFFRRHVDVHKGGGGQAHVDVCGQGATVELLLYFEVLKSF